jgi:tetratricopeptide (TPR) repeat protein
MLPTFRFALCAILALASTGCDILGGRSRDERDRLAFYKQNAGTYFLGDRYEQALDMAQRGLAIAPDDYELLVTSGLCHLQRAGEDPVELSDAEKFFDQAFEQRRFEDNRPEAILGYATVQQRLALDQERRAAAIAVELGRKNLAGSDRLAAEARAKEHLGRSRSFHEKAKRAYGTLLAREELLRYAHKGLMEIAAEQNDYESAVRHGEACLAENHKSQEVHNKVIRETLAPNEEQRSRAVLTELIDQEKRVRSALAEMHFRKGQPVRSIEQLDALLTLDPTRSSDYYNRGRALEQLGRMDEARADFEKFLGTTSLATSDERVAHAVRATTRR